MPCTQQPHRILVVDDDPDILVYLTLLLEDNGYVVESAGDTAAAFAAVDRFRPDLVLVDVLMPGRSGLDLVVSMRSDPRWKEIPLIVITGNDQILQDECKSYLGAHDGIRAPEGVLGKPMDAAALLEAVREIGTRTVAAS